MKNNITKKGFVITGTIAVIGLGIAALIGTSIFLANKNETKSMNQKTERGVDMKQSEASQDHDFESDKALINALPIEEISAAEKESLILMREEEKLARDVYRTLYEKWGLNTFQNISYSEDRHSLAVKELLDRYDIIDPVVNDATGVFTLPEIQELYTNLVTEGSESLVAGLMVAATIEDLDIKDLQDGLSQTDNQDITMIYENLMRGSRNHMRSFSKQLENNGASYTAQYLSQSEIDEILAGDQEKGSHVGDSSMEQGGQGKGNGGGQGMGQGGGGNR